MMRGRSHQILNTKLTNITCNKCNLSNISTVNEQSTQEEEIKNMIAKIVSGGSTTGPLGWGPPRAPGTPNSQQTKCIGHNY